MSGCAIGLRLRAIVPRASGFAVSVLIQRASAWSRTDRLFTAERAVHADRRKRAHRCVGFTDRPIAHSHPGVSDHLAFALTEADYQTRFGASPGQLAIEHKAPLQAVPVGPFEETAHAKDVLDGGARRLRTGCRASGPPRPSRQRADWDEAPEYAECGVRSEHAKRAQDSLVVSHVGNRKPPRKV